MQLQHRIVINSMWHCSKFQLETDRFTNKLRCAKHLSTLDVVGQLACQSKVNDLHSVIGNQHQVLRLHINTYTHIYCITSTLIISCDNKVSKYGILSLSILTAIFPGGRGWVSRYQYVSILDFIVGAEDDGGCGNNWSYKTYKAPVKSSPPPTNQHPVFSRPDALPVAQPTVSKH